ncbi:MAG: DNA-processing protein DprA [Lachnospiraceae bacterium]|nr:DNA-processing protein DprA [Lachnospiraceae bacterium]
MEEMFYWFWMASLEQIPAGKRIKIAMRLKLRLEELYNNISELENILKDEGLTEKQTASLKDEKLKEEIKRKYERMIYTDIKMYRFIDKEYPEKLLQIHNPPFALFVKGNLPNDEKKTIGVVGSRACSEYGKAVATQMSYELSLENFQIISGLAIGIDTAGHNGAIMAKKPTFAVVGNGVNLCYPIQNQRVYDQILEHNGGIISEYTIDTKALSYHFPDRNRIISGLSDAILVIEAAERGGILITANDAVEQIRIVMAVPGRANDVNSQGTNLLIKKGAVLVQNSADVIGEFYNINQSYYRLNRTSENFMLVSEEKIVYDSLDLQPRHIEEIVQRTGLEYVKCLEIINKLINKNAAMENLKNFYSKRLGSNQ